METRSGHAGVNLVDVTMTHKDFLRFAELVRSRCGIKMPEAKKSMLESRLRKRLRVLGMDSFHEYWDYVSSPVGQARELSPLIDAVTTNKTDFFREADHFQYLVERAVPCLASVSGAGLSRELKVWSAGCATGKEPYTLAMVLLELARQVEGFRFNILGTDISSRALETARSGIYQAEKAGPIPERLRKKYLLRSRDVSRDLIRVAPEVRARVRLKILNFLDEEYDVDPGFDVIFCRNVLIYFERQDQFRILSRVIRHLHRDGYLFTGHSETLHSMELPLAPVAPSVYRLKAVVRE